MEIKYVGPKPFISTGGITFDNEKSDKFIYFHSLIQLMQAIDHDYEEGRPYVYEVEARLIRGSDMSEMIMQCCPEVAAVAKEAKVKASLYVDENRKRAENSPFLCEIETQVLVNNLNLMQNYTVQRYVNKCTYYYMVERFIERLRHNKIAYISMPVHATYFHVLNTIQRGLRQQKSPVSSNLSFHSEGRETYVRLNIVN